MCNEVNFMFLDKDIGLFEPQIYGVIYPTSILLSSGKEVLLLIPTAVNKSINKG